MAGAFKAGTKWQPIGPVTPGGADMPGAQMWGAVEPPDWEKYQVQEGIRREAALWDDPRKEAAMGRAFNMMKTLFDDGQQTVERGGRSAFSTPGIPAPRYMNAGPVWSQQQINAQSNLQRGNLLSQANNQSAQFNNQLANRGFSPLSPFGMLNQQSNLMRANAGAAANETNLNWTAAKGNSDAALQAGGINAKLYGDYAQALGNSRNAQMDYDIRKQQLGLSRSQQQNQMMLAIMQGLL